MKKALATFCVVLLCAPLAAAVYGQGSIVDRDRDKRAQSGLQFLDTSVNPRAAAMADAASALDLSTADAAFYNPALLANLTGGSVALGTFQWIADISYNSASLAYSPSGGRYGVIGVSFMSVDYGDLEGTIIDQDPTGPGYVRTGNFSPSALAVGLGYAKGLTDRFSVGGHVRYAYQDLGDTRMSLDGDTQGNSVSTPVFDFGVLYRTGFRSLNLAITARNFSPAVTYEEESFEAPLSLNVGLAMNVLDVFAPEMTNQSFLVSLEAGNPRSYDEQIRIGGEYSFMNTFALRAGYVFPADEQGLNLGAGVNVDVGGLSFGGDYAYSAFGDLGNVNRLGIHLGF